MNNAYDPIAPYSSIFELSAEQLQRNFDVGPIAYLRFMQAAYPYLKASETGRVINFGSQAGITGQVGYGPYSMAKEAVRALISNRRARVGRRQHHGEQRPADSPDVGAGRECAPAG